MLSMLVAVALAAGVPAAEAPAAPDRFTVRADDGTAWSGPPARVDIRFRPGAAEPEVELSFAATGDDGSRRTLLLSVPAGFLRTQALEARLTNRPLRAGLGSLQAEDSAGTLRSASEGRVQAALADGRLSGRASAAGWGALHFDGPVAVTCAVPLADGPALQVDERFESAPCRPWAALARSR